MTFSGRLIPNAGSDATILTTSSSEADTIHTSTLELEAYESVRLDRKICGNGNGSLLTTSDWDNDVLCLRHHGCCRLTKLSQRKSRKDLCGEQ